METRVTLSPLPPDFLLNRRLVNAVNWHWLYARHEALTARGGVGRTYQYDFATRREILERSVNATMGTPREMNPRR